MFDLKRKKGFRGSVFSENRAGFWFFLNTEHGISLTTGLDLLATVRTGFGRERRCRGSTASRSSSFVVSYYGEWIAAPSEIDSYGLAVGMSSFAAPVALDDQPDNQHECDARRLDPTGLGR